MEPKHFSIEGEVIENVSPFNFFRYNLDEGFTWKNIIDLIKLESPKQLMCSID